MGSHIVTCHPTEVRIPPLPTAEAGTRFSDRGGMQGWVDLCYVKATGRELNPRPVNHKSNALPYTDCATGLGCWIWAPLAAPLLVASLLRSRAAIASDSQLRLQTTSVVRGRVETNCWRSTLANRGQFVWTRRASDRASRSRHRQQLRRRREEIRRRRRQSIDRDYSALQVIDHRACASPTEDTPRVHRNINTPPVIA